MEVWDVAVGFLYHAASGKVLLHLRGADKPPNPGKWAFFGARCEPEDGGDLLTTRVSIAVMSKYRRKNDISLRPNKQHYRCIGKYSGLALCNEIYRACQLSSSNSKRRVEPST
jgi:hypothetical protein